MAWLTDYWWLILLFLVGIFLNTIRDLNKVSFKHYLDKKNGPAKPSSEQKASPQPPPDTNGQAKKR